MQSQNETAMISTLNYFHPLKLNEFALIKSEKKMGKLLIHHVTFNEELRYALEWHFIHCTLHVYVHE